MKTIKQITFLTFIICFNVIVKAQNFPYGFNYQAVARDAVGNAQSNQMVNVRFSIHKSTAGGILIWQETQSQTTNSMGQFNMTIGNGSRTAGTATVFSDIDWRSDVHYLDVEIQTGVSTYASIGVQQLMSVPYAISTPAEVPVGSVLAYFGTTPPPGWLLCNGAAISRITYAKLYAVIVNSSGYGNNSTTFNLPDLRGMFLRGVDGGSGNDVDAATRTAQNAGGNTGNNVASFQDEEFKSHSHGMSGNPSTTGVGNSSFYSNTTAIYKQTASSGGNETRPLNVSVNYIIKY